jgi:hypothetical protein
LLVPAPRRYERFQLRRIGQPWSIETETETEAEAEVVYSYRLTPRSLRRARRQRISLSRLTEFLEEATGRSIPAGLQDTLRVAYEEGAKARVAHLWVLRAQDPEVLEDEEIQGLVHASLDVGVVTVRETNLQALLAALTRSGVLPDVETSPSVDT